MEIDFFFKCCLINVRGGTLSSTTETQHQTTWSVERQGHMGAMVLCVHGQNGGRWAGLQLYGSSGSRAISEGLIRGDQVVSSTGRSQDS